MGHDETDAVQAEVRDGCRVVVQLDGAVKPSSLLSQPLTHSSSSTEVSSELGVGRAPSSSWGIRTQALALLTGAQKSQTKSRSHVNRNSVCPAGSRGARGSPVNWPRKLMGRLHKAHTGQSRDHPIGAPPTLQTTSGRVRSGFRTDQVGKWLSTGCSLQF